MASGCAMCYQEGRRKKKQTLDGEERRRERPSTITPPQQTLNTCTCCNTYVLVTSEAVQTTDVTYSSAPLYLEIEGCDDNDDDDCDDDYHDDDVVYSV